MVAVPYRGDAVKGRLFVAIGEQGKPQQDLHAAYLILTFVVLSAEDFDGGSQE